MKERCTSLNVAPLNISPGALSSRKPQVSQELLRLVAGPGPMLTEGRGVGIQIEMVIDRN